MKDPLNRENGQAILRLFDACFKQGVLDAYGAGDDFAVRDFVSRYNGKFTFATFDEPDGIDWRSYRFVLYKWARVNRCSRLAENYVLRIRSLNYLWCLLPYCMWFYMMGAKEWLSFPNSSAIAIFKMRGRVHWDPDDPMKVFKRMDYVSYMHEACAAYDKLDEEDKPVSGRVMASFVEAIYTITR